MGWMLWVSLVADGALKMTDRPFVCDVWLIAVFGAAPK
jgi:hypothetical protein